MLRSTTQTHRHLFLVLVVLLFFFQDEFDMKVHIDVKVFSG